MATIKTPVAGDGVTVIGDSVRVRGTLSGDEDLHILGRVDGRVELQRTLVVAESGIVKAEVSVKNAVISGVVVGNVHASESVEITKEGRMVGDIYAPRVIIVDGASFRGNVDMGDIANMPARKPEISRPRPTPAPIVRSSSASKPGKTTPPTPVAPAAPVKTAPVPAKPAAASEKPAETKPVSVAAAAKPASIPASTPASTTPLEPPAAKGLPQKANKTRVIVKRK
jgi:cytoskeletal protein CcmA (bactofilin family)